MAETPSLFEEVRAKVGNREVRIVALGDSITQGGFEATCLEPNNAYCTIVREALERAYPGVRVHLVNAGVSMDHVIAGLRRVDADVVAHRPDVVFVSYGVNDAGGGAPALHPFRLALERIIARVREVGAVPVLLTPSFIADRMNERIVEMHREIAAGIINIQTSGSLAAYAQTIRAIGASLGVVVADVHAAWAALARNGADTTAMLANGLNHPDRPRQRMAAEIVFSAITGRAMS